MLATSQPNYVGSESLLLPLRNIRKSKYRIIPLRTIGERVREMAKVCDDRVIDLIASGYNKRVLPHAWLALITELAGIELEIQEPEPVPQRFGSDLALVETGKVVEEVKSQLKDFWVRLR